MAINTVLAHGVEGHGWWHTDAAPLSGHWRHHNRKAKSPGKEKKPSVLLHKKSYWTCWICQPLQLLQVLRICFPFLQEMAAIDMLRKILPSPMPPPLKSSCCAACSSSTDLVSSFCCCWCSTSRCLQCVPLLPPAAVTTKKVVLPAPRQQKRASTAKSLQDMPNINMSPKLTCDKR